MMSDKKNDAHAQVLVRDAEQRPSLLKQIIWMLGVYVASVLAMVMVSYGGRLFIKKVLWALQSSAIFA